MTTLKQRAHDKKTVKVASPPPSHRKGPNASTDSVASSPTPVSHATRGGAEGIRTFSTVFWDLIFSATGYKRSHLEALRATDENTLPTHDVIELAAPDLSWADASAVHTLRVQLQAYVESLRVLKGENAKQLRSRPFVEQKRYEAMRSREFAGRVTPETITASFQKLDLSDRRLEVISDEDVIGFDCLRELTLSRNALRFLDTIPSTVQVLIASGNAIEHVEPSAVERCHELYVVGLASNHIQDISFVLSSASIVSLDVSYNPISSLEDVIEILRGHPTLRHVNFEGCPVAFFQGYRSALIAACPSLVSIDGVAIVREEPESNVPGGAASMSASATALPTVQSPRKAVAVAPVVSTSPVPPLTNLPGSEPLASALKNTSQVIAPPTVFIQLVGLRGVQVLQPDKELSENRLPSAGGKKPAPPPKKGAAKAVVEEERGPQNQLVFNLSGSWNSALAVSVQDIELQPPPQVVEDPKAAKASAAAAAKGSKGAAAAAAVASDASNAPPPDAEAAIKIPPLEAVLDQPTSTLVPWMAPLLLDLEFSDYLVAPVTGTPTVLSNSASPNTPDLLGASAQQPSRALQSSQWLGTFVVPMFETLIELSQAKQSSSTTRKTPNVKQLLIPLTAQRNTIAQAHTLIQQRRTALAELMEEDQRLDAILADIVTAEMDAPAPALTAQSPVPAAKGKAPSKQAAAPVKQLSEATVLKQQESANRKLSIEEAANVIKEDEKKVERLAKADKLVLVLQISLNTPILTETKQPEAVVAPTPAAAAGKKK